MKEVEASLEDNTLPFTLASTSFIDYNTAMDEKKDVFVAIQQQNPRPQTRERAAWKAYWEGCGQPWRTEPEIDENRQAVLTAHRATAPDLDEGLYPFRGVRLERADVEWLLATHEGGRGPVDIQDWQQLDRKGIDLRGADLSVVNLSYLPLARMIGGLSIAERLRPPEIKNRAAVHLEGAILDWTHLEEAELYMARLEKADLYHAHLEGASLRKAHLEGASLRRAYVGGAFIQQRRTTRLPVERSDGARASAPRPAHTPERVLLPTDLRAVFLNSETDLEDIHLGSEQYGLPRMADVHWNDVSLGVVDWSRVKTLGDEQKARKETDEMGAEKGMVLRLREYREATRANRQLAVALQNRGLNEEAARFAFRAQLLQRHGLRLRKKWGAYTFSLFLEMLAGYGYRPARSLLAYLIVIACFTATYFILGRTVGPPFSPLGALVFSVTSFHGRGFFPGGIKLDDPITVLAALEAVVGLTIEISFIATFTQRFFGK